LWNEKEKWKEGEKRIDEKLRETHHLNHLINPSSQLAT